MIKRGLRYDSIEILVFFWLGSLIFKQKFSIRLEWYNLYYIVQPHHKIYLKITLNSKGNLKKFTYELIINFIQETILYLLIFYWNKLKFNNYYYSVAKTSIINFKIWRLLDE